MKNKSIKSDKSEVNIGNELSNEESIYQKMCAVSSKSFDEVEKENKEFLKSLTELTNEMQYNHRSMPSCAEEMNINTDSGPCIDCGLIWE